MYVGLDVHGRNKAARPIERSAKVLNDKRPPDGASARIDCWGCSHTLHLTKDRDGSLPYRTAALCLTLNREHLTPTHRQSAA